jgi:hypothetical protein
MSKWLVSTAVLSRPSSLLATAGAFICGIYVLAQYIHIINADHKLMCPIEFQSVLGYLDHLMAKQGCRPMAMKHFVSGHCEWEMSIPNFENY